MKQELNNFIEENCKECKETCEKGIVQTSEMIKCVDKNIIYSKKEDDTYELRKVLMKFGISANLQGFHYIIAAWKFIKNQSIHVRMTTVYEYIVKYYNAKSIFEVERAIRHSIENSYNSNKLLTKIYGEKPNNKMFLYDLVFNFDIFKKF